MPISVDTRQNLPSRLASDWELNKRLDHHRIQDFAHLFLILILSIVQLYFDAYLNVAKTGFNVEVFDEYDEEEELPEEDILF